MVVSKGTIFFEPRLECKMFAERFLVSFFGYSWDVCELLMFGSGFSFVYTKMKSNEKSYFLFYGRKFSILKGVVQNIGGEYIESYRANIEDLRYIVEKFTLPVVVSVDFKKIIPFYPDGFIKQKILSILEEWDKRKILEEYPHEIVVVGVDSNFVYWGDHLSQKILKTEVQKFQEIWELSFYSAFSSGRRLEYIVLPRSVLFEKKYIPILFANSLASFLINMRQGYEEKEYVVGLHGIERLLVDLEKKEFEKNEYEFSSKLLYDFNGLYWHGLYRKEIGHFINKYKEILRSKYNKKQLENINALSKRLAIDWEKFIRVLYENKTDFELVKTVAKTVLEGERYLLEEIEKFLL